MSFLLNHYLGADPGGATTSSRWRIITDAGSATLQLQEVEMRDTIGGADLCTGGTASADAGTAANAFDDNTSTGWAPGTPTTPGHWLEYDFGTPVDIIEVSIRVNSTSGPPAFSIQYHDGSGWITAWSEVAQVWASSGTNVYSKPVPGAASGFVGSLVYSHSTNAAITVNLTFCLDENGRRVALQEDDIVVVNHINARNANVGDSNLLISGFTDVLPGVDLHQNHNNDTNQMVQLKVMGSTPDTTFSAPASGGSGEGYAGTVHVFRGIDTTTPLDVAPTYTGGVGNLPPDPSAITPATAGAIILVCVGASVGNATIAAGFDLPGDLSSATNHFRTAWHSGGTEEPVVGTGIKTDWVSGAFNPGTWSGVANASDRTWSAVSLALRPA